MFGVVSAVTLLALISIAIPIAIHLINPGKGKVVWVGNIQLLKQAKKHRVKEYRIEQWPLLLLRIFMLAVLTLLVAGTYFNGSLPGLSQNQTVVSSAWLESSKEQISVDYILEDRRIWQQLVVLDKTLPKDDTIEVYVTDSFSAFDSPTKPKLEREVRWHVLSGGNADKMELKPRQLTVYANQPNELLENALNAIKATRLPFLKIHRAKPDEPVPQFTDWLIYLPQGELSLAIKQQVANGAVLLRVADDDGMMPWGSGVITSMSIDEKPDLANRLLDKFALGISNTERFSGGTLSESEINLALSQNAENTPSTSLSDFLLFLLVVLFLLDRYWAERVGRGDA